MIISTAGRLIPLSCLAFISVFHEIGNGGLFINEEQEKHWWQELLPLVPAVTGVLLRQQNRRKWKPTTLEQMFSRLPRLQEIHHEPWGWRHRYNHVQLLKDQCEYCSVGSWSCVIYIFVFVSLTTECLQYSIPFPF